MVRYVEDGNSWTEGGQSVTECRGRFVIMNERHVHGLVKEYKIYFNHGRPQQGIERRAACQTERWDAPHVTATLSSRPVLNGLWHDCS